MAELYAPRKEFPVDVAAVDFANPTPQYRFGLNRERAIQRLRDFADKLESNDYLLQGVEFSQKASLADYTLSTLAITYAEKKTVKPVENNLEA